MVATPEKPIGQSIARVDAVERVIGRAVYAPDLTLPGTLHCKILRSPIAHAKIKSIDTSAAEAYPGVKAVVTHIRICPRLSRMSRSAARSRWTPAICASS